MTTHPQRILITGAEGFVGGRLVARLGGLPDTEVVAGVYGHRTAAALPAARTVALDVTDIAQVRTVLSDLAPTHVIHLAAVASPAGAQKQVEAAWRVNAEGPVNVALAILSAAPQARLIHASTGEIYGGSFRDGEPVDEAAPVDPSSIYGASKAAADLMIGQMGKLGLRAVRLRLFNHTGAGQSEDFVVPAFAAQIARIEHGLQAPVIEVGDLTARRDFLAVEDAIDAYAATIDRFDGLPADCVLNIASGRTLVVGDILDRLLAHANCAIEVRVDPARLQRPGPATASGDPGLARRLLGWTPSRDIDETLAGVLDFFRARYAGHSGA